MEKHSDIFYTIIEEHKGILYKIANSYCKDKDDRQDLLQEIIVQLWLSYGKYDSQFKLSTWIYRIALNTSISFYRKNKTRKEKTVELSPILETSIMEDSPFPDDSNIIRLQGFIQELKEFDKALILLYLDGLTQKEISEILGITPSNISTKIGRIKKTLKNKFQNKKN